MKTTLLLGLVTLFFTSVYAQNLVRDGEFNEGFGAWELQTKSQIKLDKKIFVSPPNSLQIETKENSSYGGVFQQIKLEPYTDYALTFYMKGEKINGTEGGARVSLKADKKFLLYSHRGIWKFGLGTFEWQKGEFTFNSSYFDATVVTLALQLVNATGIAWFDDIVLSKVEKKMESIFNAEFFPINFGGSMTYTICENFPGNLDLYSTVSGQEQKNKLIGKKAVMTLDLPDFLTLRGVSESYPLGKKVFATQTQSESGIERNGQPYRRYQIEFNEKFVEQINTGGTNWYRQNFFLIPVNGSAGREADFYWSLKIGDLRQAEKTHHVKILPPLAGDRRKTKIFRAGSCSINGLLSPFKDISDTSINFWKSLSSQPVLLHIAHGLAYGHYYAQPLNDKGFDTGLMIFYNKSIPLLELFGKNKCAEMETGKLKNKYPVFLWENGQQNQGSFPSWYTAEDPDGVVEKYQREAYSAMRLEYPRVKFLDFDFEPFAQSFDEEGRKRFGQYLKLDHIPSIIEIKNQYHRQWLDYHIKLHQQIMVKTTSIVREVWPEVELWGCTAHLVPPPQDRLFRVFATDADQFDPLFDIHCQMQYSSGLSFFNEIAFNRQELKKPIWAMCDPSERDIRYWNRYTPPKLYQNIIAAAAHGAVGFNLWPDDVLFGDYFHVLQNAFHEIAGVEEYYFNGKRADDQVKITVKNVCEKIVKDDNGETVKITYPDFSKTLKTVVHEKDGKHIATVFNYDKKNPIIVDIDGKLYKIDVDGVKIIRVGEGGEDLASELKTLSQQLNPSDKFKELKSGSAEIDWKIYGQDRSPVLRLSNPKASLLLSQSGMGVSFKADTIELVGDGFLGKFLFLGDTQEPGPYPFVLKDLTITDGACTAEFVYTVPPYPGADPRVNLLAGLILTKSYTLKDRSVTVNVAMHNPTQTAMKLGFRISNYPYVGSRFGLKNLKVALDDSVVNLKSPQNNLFLKNGETVSFLPNQEVLTWLGGNVVVSANDRALKDQVSISPQTGFSGVFCWKGSAITVEFLQSDFLIQPLSDINFSYQVSTP